MRDQIALRDQIAKLETLTQKGVLDKQASRNISFFCFLALSWLGQIGREERRGEEKRKEREEEEEEGRKEEEEGD